MCHLQCSLTLAQRRLLQSLLNSFCEDMVHISVRHLLQVVAKQGWSCMSVFHVTQYATNVSHYIAILDTGHPICDCMMGTNLGLPCRHFYSVLRASDSICFHLGLVNRRWLSDPTLDLTTTQAVTIGHKSPTNLTTTVIPHPLPSLHRPTSPQPITRALPPKVIHHQAITKFQDVLHYVHTEEELQNLTADIDVLM
jgi:hypothetical protein